MLRKIDYTVKRNGKVVKHGTTRVDFKKLKDFEIKMINEFTKNPAKDVIEIYFR